MVAERKPWVLCVRQHDADAPTCIMVFVAVLPVCLLPLLGLSLFVPFATTFGALT